MGAIPFQILLRKPPASDRSKTCSHDKQAQMKVCDVA
jgi:hypothetical protein